MLAIPKADKEAAQRARRVQEELAFVKAAAAQESWMSRQRGSCATASY